MRKGGVFADLAAGVAGDTAARIRGVNELGELTIGHAGLCGLVGRLVDGEGDIVRELHEGELGGSLDGAAAVGDGGRAGGGEGGAGLGDAIGEDELGALFDANLAGGDAGFFEGFGEKFVGVFVFVPGVDASGGGGGKGGGFGLHALADSAFFEDWTDDERCAFGGERPGEETLGLTPAKAGEVSERGSGGDDDGVDCVLVHERAGTVEALLAFGECDGDSFRAAARESSDSRREILERSLFSAGRLRCETQGWRRRGCCGGRKEEAAAIEHGCE